jgi:hypothetical protein
MKGATARSGGDYIIGYILEYWVKTLSSILDTLEYETLDGGTMSL